MKKNKRNLGRVLGASLFIIWLFSFLPGWGQGNYVDQGVLAIGSIQPSHSFMFCSDTSGCLSLDFGDTLKVESDIPISEGAEIFIEWLKTRYECEMYRLNRDNKALIKEVEYLREKGKKSE